MAPIFEYFVVCGIGPEIRTLDGSNGFYGFNFKYEASLIDQFPPPGQSLRAPLPPELSRCVLPAGIEFYASGFHADDPLSYPRSYPIVLTEGDGSKIYVSCIAFRDSIDEDIAEAYDILPNSYAGKCISFVSRVPSFCVLRDALEEIFDICFSRGSRKPLWEVIAATVSNVPLPTLGNDRVLFAIDNCLLSVEAPPEYGLPQADISFEPLVQCLDVHNLIMLFTAVLLERRILLLSDKYSLLTLVSESICHLIYPFQWQYVYIPILFSQGVDYIDAPTPYIIGLHSSVDTSGLLMDGVVIVDIDNNCITTSEVIPPIPEPESSSLQSEIMNLLYPSVMHIDEINIGFGPLPDRCARVPFKPWGESHDFQLRLIFLKFFATILSGYHNFIIALDLDQEHALDSPFNVEAFIMQRSHSNRQLPDAMLPEFLGSQGFSNYIAKVRADGVSDYNILEKLQEALRKGQNPMSIFPSPVSDPVTITIPDPTDGILDTEGKHIYDRFPANRRTDEQKEKREQILQSIKDKNDELRGIILDIKEKLKGLWISLLKLEPADVLVSDDFETILALIETDAKGIVGSAFVESIREDITMGWNCQLSEEQFIAVKELVKAVITRASYQNDFPTLRDTLEVSAQMYKKDFNNVSDYLQRHLISLPIWQDPGFWERFFDHVMEQSSCRSSDNTNLIISLLVLMASHMAGLGIPGTDAWLMIDNVAEKQNIEYEHYMHLRGYLSYIYHLHMAYWGITDLKAESLPSHGLQSPRLQDSIDSSQQRSKASTLAKNWVKSMFGGDAALKMNSFNLGRGSPVEIETAIDDIGTPRKKNLPSIGQKKTQTNMRVLRGHRGAVTSLHCVTRGEVWDLTGDREDAGFFISGGTDCSVRIWDPSLRGAELRATLRGHTGAVRAISSDRWKLISGSDDLTILVWDKSELIPVEELKGHDARISRVRMLSGDRVLSSAHDGTVKMWDARNGSCIATVAKCPSAILCTEFDDSNGILAIAGQDSLVHIWDIRYGKLIHKLSGHSKWVRSIRMVGDTLISGSDDWTARIWSISQGSCNAVLACHGGSVLCVEHSESDKVVMTGSNDGFVRFWENSNGNFECSKDVNLHSSVLSITAQEQWLGIGAADNSMSLFHKIPQPKKTGVWQLYRTPQTSAAVVRCVASDLDRKRICSGSRDGLLRLWDATINV